MGMNGNKISFYALKKADTKPPEKSRKKIRLKREKKNISILKKSG